MPEFLVAALRIGFLALVWAFIALAAGVIRTDIFGERLSTEPAAAKPRRLGRRRKPTATPEPALQAAPVARQLVVVEGRSKGAIVPLEGVMGIGRASSAIIQIDDDFASSRHAVLRPDGDQWMVEDLQSTNGTYVNAVQISQPTLVGPGDLIRIGRTQMRLEA